jgi:uncharacterized protein YbjT (DUF2867 family)
MSKTAAIIGITGLIGSELYDLLKNDTGFEYIRLIVRRPLTNNHPRTEVKLVDFNDAESLQLALEGCETIFCAVGTTKKKVKGDQQAYRKIDFDIPVHAAQYGMQTGCEKFILVSAVGANPKSSNFYLRLKGEVEEAIKSIGLASVHVMRPSFLLGDRKEHRAGEKLAAAVMKTIGFLFPPKYKAIPARTVASAMIASAKKDGGGFFVHEYKEMKEFAMTL